MNYIKTNHVFTIIYEIIFQVRKRKFLFWQWNKWQVQLKWQHVTWKCIFDRNNFFFQIFGAKITKEPICGGREEKRWFPPSSSSSRSSPALLILVSYFHVEIYCGKLKRRKYFFRIKQIISKFIVYVHGILELRLHNYFILIEFSR